MIDRIRVWIREETERAAERKAALKPDPPHVTVPAWLVSSARAASWLAMATLVYFLFIFTLDVAGDQSEALHITHAGTWIGDVQFWLPLIIGYVLIAIGVPYMAKIIIPIFISLTWREHLWPKAWSLFLVLAFSCVVFAGTFSVQGKTIMEHGRDSAVAVAQVNNDRAGVQARIDGITADLNTMMNNSNAYLAQAASVGAAEWENTYIANARASGDAQLGRIERALGAARAADALRAERETLRVRLAQAPVAEQVQERVETAGTSWIGATLDWLVGARAILLSLTMDVVCLLMPWIALRLEQTRNRQLGMGDQSGWAPEDHRIEDLRADEPITPQPMKPPREVVRDADTGEELVKITPRPHWRKRKGKPQKVEADVMAMADETGVPDGGDRTGRSAPEVVQSTDTESGLFASDEPLLEPATPSAAAPSEETTPEHQQGDSESAKQHDQIDLPDLPITADAIDALAGLLAQQEPDADSDASEQQQSDDPGDDTHTKLPANEGVMVRELAAAK